MAVKHAAVTAVRASGVEHGGWVGGCACETNQASELCSPVHFSDSGVQLREKVIFHVILLLPYGSLCSPVHLVLRTISLILGCYATDYISGIHRSNYISI